MPNRILKESICASDSVDQLTWFEEVLFYRLIVNCDDFGRFDGRASIIKNRLFPLKENLTLKAVAAAINKLANVGLVVLYEFEDKPYLHLPTWNAHQNVRAKRSKYPSPDEAVNTSASKCNHVYADVPVIQSESESVSESNAIECADIKAGTKRSQKFTPPTVEEVKEYCLARGNGVDANRFVDYYTANGWIVGRNKMKDWRAAVRTWEQREKQQQKSVYTSSADRMAAMIERGDFDD